MDSKKIEDVTIGFDPWLKILPKQAIDFDLRSFICKETPENWQSLAIHSNVEYDVAIKEKFQI